METIKLTELIIAPDRQRKEFEKESILDLAESIKRKGLMHPIVVQNDGLTLVAGERRFKAITQLTEQEVEYTCNTLTIPVGSIPILKLSKLSDLELFEAELEENVLRVDLSWQERSKAQADLHQLRVDQHGEYDKSSKEGWTITDTATEIRGRKANQRDIANISDAIEIAEFLDDPIISAAKSKKEAKRLIREEKKNRVRQEKMSTFDPSQSKHQLLQGDFYSFPFKEKYNVIIADPPYGIDIDKFTSWDGTKHEYDDSEAAFQKVLDRLASKLFDVCAEQAHAYIFCDIRRFNELFVAFELAGWSVWDRPLIWGKGNTGSFANADYGPRRTYEAILFANKNKRKVTQMYTDVINISQPAHQNHPAGKPPELYEDLLKRSAQPGDLILDPYCGSGPVFPAAETAFCTATGIEINEKYHNMAAERIMEISK